MMEYMIVKLSFEGRQENSQFYGVLSQALTFRKYHDLFRTF